MEPLWDAKSVLTIPEFEHQGDDVETHDHLEVAVIIRCDGTRHSHGWCPNEADPAVWPRCVLGYPVMEIPPVF